MKVQTDTQKRSPKAVSYGNILSVIVSVVDTIYKIQVRVNAYDATAKYAFALTNISHLASATHQASSQIINNCTTSSDHLEIYVPK